MAKQKRLGYGRGFGVVVTVVLTLTATPAVTLAELMFVVLVFFALLSCVKLTDLPRVRAACRRAPLKLP